VGDLVLYRAGDVVVVVGLDGEAAGDLAGRLVTEGRRAATFIGDPRDEAVQSALQVFAKEQFGSAAEIVKDSNLEGDIR
jgi:hypothetical protein